MVLKGDIWYKIMSAKDPIEHAAKTVCEAIGSEVAHINDPTLYQNVADMAAASTRKNHS